MPNSQLIAASQRGIQWILAQQRANGSFCDPQDGIGGYYKVPYALALTGQLWAAQRLASWIAGHHFTSQGDFRAPQRKAREPFHESWPAYANAWLVQGLHRLGRYDLSLPGADFLLSLQAPSGGFITWDGEARILEPVCTAWGGLAVLATGHLAAACHAGDLLVRLVKGQPDAGRFYFCMDLAGNLLADVPAGKELFYYVDASRPEQIYYYPGITLIFLMYLYRATGEPRYLDAGRALFAFTEGCAGDVYAFPPSGKLGMGCALLFDVTGDEQARRAARQVGEYLAAMQQADGSWRLPDLELYAGIANRDAFEVQLDLTAEYSIFLAEIAALTD